MKPNSGGSPAIDSAATPAASGREGHRPAEPAEAVHVARARLVVQRAGDEEEGALVQGVTQQERHRRVDRERPAEPQEERQHARGR